MYPVIIKQGNRLINRDTIILTCLLILMLRKPSMIYCPVNTPAMVELWPDENNPRAKMIVAELPRTAVRAPPVFLSWTSSVWLENKVAVPIMKTLIKNEIIVAILVSRTL